MPASRSPKRSSPVEFTPDYDRECDNCGQSPVVTAIDAAGENRLLTSLCGPCYFVESRMLDPGEWNR